MMLPENSGVATEELLGGYGVSPPLPRQFHWNYGDNFVTLANYIITYIIDDKCNRSRFDIRSVYLIALNVRTYDLADAYMQTWTL